MSLSGEVIIEVDATKVDLQALFETTALFGAPFDVNRDFGEYGGFPRDFEVRSSRDFIYFLHKPCGQILRKAAGWVGPKSIVESLRQHITTCPG